MKSTQNSLHEINPNYNIVLCGFMYSGKTTIGKQLAIKTGRYFIDTDEIIEKKSKMSINEIFKNYDETYFRSLEKKCINNISLSSNHIISTGGGTVLDKENVSNLKINGKLIFLDASFNTIISRISAKNIRPLIKNLNFAELKKLFTVRREIYLSVSDIIINANQTANLICNEIINS